MRLKLLKLLTAIGCFLLLSGNLKAQSCIPTNINGSVINLACNQVCSTLVFQVPHIKSTSDYVLSSIPFNPLPWTTPFGTQDLSLYCDDIYSTKFSMQFPFCFYDSVFSKVVIGSNGILTFDTTNASCDNSWPIGPTIFNTGGGAQCSSFETYYPKAAIMIAYSDLDPRPKDPSASCPDANASGAGRKIEWRVEGNAPCRKFVVSYFNVGTYSQPNTTPLNTLQAILYESTGIIEYYFLNRTTNSSTNGGKAIMGIQNWTRDKATAHPQRNASVWSPGATNEGWRFTPSGPGSRYVISELLDMSANVVATGDTITTTPGLLDIRFLNFCTPPGTNQFVVRTTFSACDNPFIQLISLDTITINRSNSLNATAVTTNASCGPPDGTIEITVPAGVGTPPYTYILDGGVPVVWPTSPYTFFGVAAGPHTVVVTDASAGCTSTINVTVIQNTVITANAVPTATSCSGANNGQILVTPNGGTAPYTFLLNPGAIIQTGNTALFTGLAAGTYTVMVNDAGSCFLSSPISVTVVAGPILTTTVTVTDALCNGGATGIITVTQPVIGNPPYQYSLDGIIWQASNIFNGLVAGNYTVYYRESLGCQGSQPVTVSEPAGMTSSAATVAAVCNGDINGIITITAGGGIIPYQYSIDAGVNWQASNVFTVAAGTYTIIIRDANNCTKTQIATVTEPAVLTAASVNGNASCDGGNDGVITVNAAGGNSGYTYSIDGVNFQPSNIFNVAPGTYTITVKDNLGCSTTFNTIVGLTNNLTFTPQTDPTICESNSTQLQLTSNATIYAWTPATGLSNTTISNPVANPMVTTQYTVTATLGRCSANDIVIVNVNAAPIPDAGPAGFICYGQTYQLQGSGGVQYTWTPSTNLSSTTMSNPVSTPVKTITYTLTQVIDAIGCRSLTTDQVTVDVTPPIKVKTYPYDTIGYPGDQFQLNATSAATFYSWSPATGLSNPNIANPVLTVGPLGSDVLYQVIASTAAGCRGEGYVNLKVYKGPELYVPTAFTPNGDGLNDLFYPFPVGIRSINYFKVFNRWGQLLFSSTTLYKGWDGKLQGVEQPTGVFVFMAQGVDKNGKLLTRRGTVTLIR
jgi:gliding motility-associated-like protein